MIIKFRDLFDTKVIIRFTDIFFSVLMLIIFSPLFIIIPLVIRVSSSGPALIREWHQSSRGKKSYRIYKFRTYQLKVYEKGHIKYTRFGRILYKSSLHHIPMVFNILKGEASFRDLMYFSDIGSQISTLRESELDKEIEKLDKEISKRGKPKPTPIFTEVTQSICIQRIKYLLGFCLFGIAYTILWEKSDYIVLGICVSFGIGLFLDLLLIYHRYRNRLYGTDVLELLELKEYLAAKYSSGDHDGNGGSRILYPESGDTVESMTMPDGIASEL